MLMGAIWAGMLLLALGASLLTGNGNLSAAAMGGAQNAVTLALGLAGSLCLWSAVARLMEQAGLTALLARLMRPILGRLFPQAGHDDNALGYLSANVSANLLGLGNAATPLGTAAVKRMQVLAGGTHEATDEMCLLIVINTASIQLLPTTVAAVRAAAGAQAPFDILPAVWLTSVCSVSAGVAAALLLRKRRRRG